MFNLWKKSPDSVDHIPPKNLFLPKYRTVGNELITVPAHRDCNSGASKDDEYFRYCLLIHATWQCELARELWNEKIQHRIHLPNKEGFRKRLVADLRPSRITLDSGEVLDEALLDKKRIDNVIERIARGIYYKHTDSIIPLHQRFNIRWTDPSRKTITHFQESPDVHRIANGIFKYFWQKDTMRFFFLFFDCSYFKIKPAIFNS